MKLTKVMVLIAAVLMLARFSDAAANGTKTQEPSAISSTTLSGSSEKPTGEMPAPAKIYFNVGKTSLPANAAKTVAPMVTYLKANAGAKAYISGYHDPTGNAAKNDELAKNRALSVKDLLVKSGVSADQIVLKKPRVTAGTGNLAEARRVEVSLIDDEAPVVAAAPVVAPPPPAPAPAPVVAPPPPPPAPAPKPAPVIAPAPKPEPEAVKDELEERKSDPRKMAGGLARELSMGGGPGLSNFGYLPMSISTPEDNVTSSGPGSNMSGIGGNYDFNPFLKNDAYMLINPAYVNIYKNYVWGNFDGSQSGVKSRTFAGANFAIDAIDGLTLGLLVNTKDAVIVNNTTLTDLANSGVFGGNYIPYIENTLSFLIGYQINPNFGLGAQVYTGSASTEATVESAGTTATYKNNTSVFGLDLGGVYDNNSGLKIDLAGKLRFNSLSLKREITNQTTRERKIDGGTEIDINGRAFIKVSQTVDFVPVAEFYHLNWKPVESPGSTAAAPQSTEFTTTGFAVGGGINVNLKKALVVGGVRYGLVSNEAKTTNYNDVAGNTYTEKYTFSALPVFNLGVEYYAMDWLTFRLGYTKTVYTSETKITASPASGTSTTTTTTSRGNVYGNLDNNDNVTAGVGFHFGSFNMNMALSNTFLTNGPYLLSGNSGWNSGNRSLFALFSANYSW